MTQEAHTPEHVGEMTSCPKCGLEAKTMLHPFCTHAECPVRRISSDKQKPSHSAEPKALNSPNDDAMPGAIQDALYVLRQYPADELAKHGITLAPEKDWATELWAETFDIFDRPDEAELIRRGTIDERDKEVISLFRTRFEQMIAERNKRDAQD